jgi:hypothetical protein
MESNRINPSNVSASTLLKPQPKPEPNAPKFLQALADAVENPPPRTLKAEPANLSRLVRPRSHLDLVSLNPVQTSYIPEAAALEKVGKSRIVPFVAGHGG